MRRSRGFTLVEIMVAVGVFAIVSVAIYGRIGEILRQTQRLETRTLATWVAQNRLAALALELRGSQEPVPTGRRSDRVSLGGRDWQVLLDVQATSEAGLRRVDVTVRADDGEGERSRDGDGGAAQVVGFVGNY